MDIEQALENVRTLAFPFSQEGDVVEYEGYSFIYTNGQWEIYDSTN